jgi:hypothetical protein
VDEDDDSGNASDVGDVRDDSGDGFLFPLILDLQKWLHIYVLYETLLRIIQVLTHSFHPF